MEKRTDKHKRKTYGGYYSEFKRWDLKGKTSKEVREMFLDLKKCLYYNLNRINKLKFVIEEFKKEAKKVPQINRQKEINSGKQADLENTRDRLKRALEREEKLKLDLKESVKVLNKERTLYSKLEQKLSELKKEVTSLKIKKNRTVKVKVNRPNTKEQLKIKRILDSGASEKQINNLEYVSRTNKFIKQHKLTLSQFEIITKAEVLGMLKSKDEGVTYTVLDKLTELEYLTVSTEIKGATKYWYLSEKGKDLVRDYRNYLSYGN